MKCTYTVHSSCLQIILCEHVQTWEPACMFTQVTLVCWGATSSHRPAVDLELQRRTDFIQCDKNLKKIAVKLALHSIATKLFIDMFYNCRLAMLLLLLFQSCCTVATFILFQLNHNPPPHKRFKTVVTVFMFHSYGIPTKQHVQYTLVAKLQAPWLNQSKKAVKYHC